MRFTRLVILGLILGLLLIGSCEKDNETTSLIGRWDFYKFCNKNLDIGCVYSFNRDFTETITITNKYITRSYDDSIVSSSEYQIVDTLIVYGQNEYAQQFLLRNDTLNLIDTCFACVYNVYVKK
jgi:hypothetical protein